ncbi:pre-tRNA nuclear export protein [Serendipita sp. 399]|nr:pre-tRNA nuclear export protein [Serendipita sp. 399]
MSSPEEQILQAIAIANDHKLQGQEIHSQAISFLNTVRSDSNQSWRAALALFVATNDDGTRRFGEDVRLFALNILSDFLDIRFVSSFLPRLYLCIPADTEKCPSLALLVAFVVLFRNSKGRLSNEDFATLQEQFMTYLRSEYLYGAAEGVHFFLRNKFSYALTLLFLASYETQWPTFFDDIFLLLKPPPESGVQSLNPHVSNFFFKLILEMSSEVADQILKNARHFSAERMARDGRIRDLVREKDAAKINAAVLAIVIESKQALDQARVENVKVKVSTLEEVVDNGVRAFASYVLEKLKWDEDANPEDVDDEDMMFFENMRKDIRKTIDSIYTFDADLVTGTISEKALDTLSAYEVGTELPWESAELAVYLVFMYGELGGKEKGRGRTAFCVAPPNIPKEARKTVDYSNYPLTPQGEMMQTLIRSRISTYPHPSVAMQFFETATRYADFFKVRKEHVLPALEAFLDSRGIHHPLATVRKRVFYLFHRFVQILRIDIDPANVPIILQAIQDLLTVDVEIPDEFEPPPGADILSELLKDASMFDAQLYMFEAAGSLVSILWAMPDIQASTLQAARFAFGRLIFATGSSITEYIPRLMASLLSHFEPAEFVDFIGFLSHMTHKLHEQLRGVLEEILMPLTTHISTAISQFVTGTDDSVARMDTKKAYLTFLNTIMTSHLGSIFVSQQNLPNLEPFLETILQMAADVSDLLNQKLALSFLVKFLTSFGHPTAPPTGVAGAATNGVIVVPGIEQFIYQRILVVIFGIPLRPEFNLKDGQSIAALHEIASLLQTIIKVRGDEAVSYISTIFLPSQNLSPEKALELTNNMRTMDKRGFQKYYSDVIKASRS